MTKLAFHRLDRSILSHGLSPFGPFVMIVELLSVFFICRDSFEACQPSPSAHIAHRYQGSSNTAEPPST